MLRCREPTGPMEWCDAPSGVIGAVFADPSILNIHTTPEAVGRVRCRMSDHGERAFGRTTGFRLTNPGDTS